MTSRLISRAHFCFALFLLGVDDAVAARQLIIGQNDSHASVLRYDLGKHRLEVLATGLHVVDLLEDRQGRILVLTKDSLYRIGEDRSLLPLIKEAAGVDFWQAAEHSNGSFVIADRGRPVLWQVTPSGAFSEFATSKDWAYPLSKVGLIQNKDGFLTIRETMDDSVSAYQISLAGAVVKLSTQAGLNPPRQFVHFAVESKIVLQGGHLRKLNQDRFLFVDGLSNRVFEFRADSGARLLGLNYGDNRPGWYLRAIATGETENLLFVCDDRQIYRFDLTDQTPGKPLLSNRQVEFLTAPTTILYTSK